MAIVFTWGQTWESMECGGRSPALRSGPSLVYLLCGLQQAPSPLWCSDSQLYHEGLENEGFLALMLRVPNPGLKVPSLPWSGVWLRGR